MIISIQLGLTTLPKLRRACEKAFKELQKQGYTTQWAAGIDEQPGIAGSYLVTFSKKVRGKEKTFRVMGVIYVYNIEDSTSSYIETSSRGSARAIKDFNRAFDKASGDSGLRFKLTV
jgi:hypothetical protein